MPADTPKDNQGKIEHLQQMLDSVSAELYKYCLLVGFDPETFDYKSYSERNSIGIEFNENNNFLKSYCEKIVTIEKILEELNNKELP
jgi:hypothetical protein